MKKVLIILIACLFLVSCASKVPPKKQGPGDLYVEGVNLMKKQKYDDAVKKFSEVTENYPFDPIALVAAVKLGDAHFEHKDYVMAASVYENFVSAHPEDDNAPYVLLRLGDCYDKLSLSIDRDQANTLKAIDKYSLLKNRYPRSNYAKTVDDRLRIMEQKLADREVYVGEFYYRSSQYNAATVRLEYFLKKYPGAGHTDKALYYLALSYRELAMPQKSDYYADLLRKEFPDSMYARTVIRERKSFKMSKVTDDFDEPLEGGIKRKRLKKDLPAPSTASTASTPAASPQAAPVTAPAPNLKPAAVPMGVATTAGSLQPAAGQPATAEKPADTVDQALVPQPEGDRGESVILEEDLTTRPSTSDTTPPANFRSTQAKARKSPAPKPQAAEKPSAPPEKTAAAPEANVYTSDPGKKRTIDLTPQMYAAAATPAQAPAGDGKKAADDRAADKGKAVDKDKKNLDFFDKSKPIDIVSDSMEGFDKEKYVVFKGNVIARQEDLFIFADLMEAYLNEESNEIDRAFAKNHVKIVKKERTATANEALFDNRKGEIVLKGNVVVFQGQDKLTGDVITYYVNEDRAVVEGDKAKRARAIITPTK